MSEIRVGAIAAPNSGKMALIGYGINEGLQWVHDNRVRDQQRRDNPNFNGQSIRIKLDNGEFVYSCECLIYPEWIAQQMVSKEGREIETINIETLRQGYEKPSNTVR